MTAVAASRPNADAPLVGNEPAAAMADHRRAGDDPTGPLGAAPRRSWWHPEVSARRLEQAVGGLGAFVALDVIGHLGWLRHGTVPDALAGSFGPFRRLGLPRLGLSGLGALSTVVIAAGVTTAWASRGACASRWAPTSRRVDGPVAGRVAGVVLAITYAWWSAEHAGYGTPTHARTALATTLFALAGRRRPAPDERMTSGWPMRVACAALAAMYFGAGVAKLRAVGPGWWHEGATQAGVALWAEPAVQRFVFAHRSLTNGAALAALLFELVAPVLLLAGGRFRPATAVAGACFHLAILFGMGIDFLSMAACCLAVAHTERLDHFPETAIGRNP